MSPVSLPRPAAPVTALSACPASDGDRPRSPAAGHARRGTPRACRCQRFAAMLLAGLGATAVAAGAESPANPAAAPAEASAPLAAPSPEQRAAVFRAANEAFAAAGAQESAHPARARKLYESAALRYEQLLAPGYENGRLHYNLGNTYYRLGDLGKAILHYRRAQPDLPDDPNLLHNLGRARAQRADQFNEPEETRILRTLLFWHYDLAAGTQRTLFAVFFLAFWAGLAVRLALGGKGKALPPAWTLLLCGVMWAGLLGSLAARPLEAAAERGGVILRPEVTARQGNGENYQPAFTRPLHAGTEFSCLEQRPGWLQIALPGGKRGWIPADAAALIRP